MLIGTGGLTKTGDGTLWINAAKTYGGITTVSGGALRVSDDGALGTATDASIDGTNIGNGVTARLELSGDITLAEPIQLAQKQSVAGDAPGLVNVDGNNTLTGPLALGGGGSNWNIWSNAGKLSITGTATNTNTTNTRVIRFFGAGDGEILSVLADGAGTSLTAIVMNGGGTWRLAGTNTCTGPTTVETGNLQIDGNHTASTVTVNPSGTLSGTGTLGIATATGTIAPGAGIGTLNAATVTLSGTLAIEVAGSSSDRLDVSGTLDLTGATVSVSGTPTAGSYTLASAGSPITGTPVLAAPLSGYELLVEGNLLKLNSLGGGSPFESWATLNGAAPNLADDHDNDGVSNGIEYFLGGPNANTTGFTLLPGVSNTGGPLSITWIKGSGYTGTYGTDFRVETSDILSGSWTEETLIGGNVTDDPGFVKFIFPAPLDTKKFARLKVTGP
jgi:autotransporter-associated beta strand protein